MVFKRRERQSTLNWLRQSIYPRTGWRRAIEYLIHRVRRLPDSPHRVARGLACGVFVSFSPLFGFHFIYAAALAWFIRGNIVASLIGTFFGNPLTFPFIAGASLWIGRRVLGLGSGEEVPFNVELVAHAFGQAFIGLWETLLSTVGLGSPSWDKLSEFFVELFVPYFFGGLFPGVACAAIVYALSVPIVKTYQARRRERLRQRVARRSSENLPLGARPGKHEG